MFPLAVKSDMSTVLTDLLLSSELSVPTSNLQRCCLLISKLHCCICSRRSMWGCCPPANLGGLYRILFEQAVEDSQAHAGNILPVPKEGHRLLHQNLYE